MPHPIFTAGPWAIVSTIDTPHGDHDIGFGVTPGGDCAGIIARISASKRVSPEVAAANATLIIAAPDLLAAVEQLIRAHDRHSGGNSPLDGLIDTARAAAAKARGL